MKIELITSDGQSYEATEPHPAAQYVNVGGWTCPACGSATARGCSDNTETHDQIRCMAMCAACFVPVGELLVTVSTIFGIAEDRAVLCGRPRVF